MSLNKDKKILVMDDQRDSLFMLKRILEEMKYENIELLTSAEKGLKLIEANRDKPFDIILSDYNMGERMNGQQLLEEVTRRNLMGYNSLFIMVSAETSKEMVLSALECRPDAYITKPFNFNSVSEKINRLIQEKNLLQPVFKALKDGEYSEAIKTCRDIVGNSTTPKLSLLRFFGDILLEHEEYEEAGEQFLKCMPSNPPDWAVMGHARALVGMGQEERAIEILEGLVNTVTTELKAYDLLAKLKLTNNQPIEAQQILSKAIALAPNTFLRQRSFAQLCLDNGDTDSAVRSSKHALKLAQYTSHNSPNNYVILAQAQMAHAEKLGPSDSQRMVSEALNNMAVAAEDNQASDWVSVSLMLGETLQKKRSGDINEHYNLLEQAEHRALESVQFPKEELPCILGCAKQFHALGSVETANHILKRLGEVFSEDAEVLARLDRVSNEPVTAAGKQKAAAINSDGISLYKSGDFEAALAKFKEGIGIFPRSAEFHLNYILSAVSKMESLGRDSGLADKCYESIELIKKLDDSEQYKERLSKMAKRLNAI